MIINWLSDTIELPIWEFILLGTLFCLFGAFHALCKERKRLEGIIEELHRQLDEAQKYIDH